MINVVLYHNNIFNKLLRFYFGLICKTACSFISNNDIHEIKFKGII